jgi:hypothetical protein
VLKAEDPEKAEEVAQFLIQEDIKASKIEELLESQKYQECWHSCLVSE